jgi:hypothetical protein
MRRTSNRPARSAANDPAALFATLWLGTARLLEREYPEAYAALAARLRGHGLAMDGGLRNPRQRPVTLPPTWLLRPDLAQATPGLMARVRAFAQDSVPLRRTGQRRVSVAPPLMVSALYYSELAKARLRRVPYQSPSQRAIESVARFFGWTSETAERAVKRARRRHRFDVHLGHGAMEHALRLDAEFF